MIRTKRMAFMVVCLSALSVAPLLADVKLPAVIGDHMVLQQGVPVPIWGTADPGEEVTVSLNGQKKTATAGADGRWIVRFEPLKADDGPVEMMVAGKNRITVSDILVGEVWVCSGQSNMQWPVRLSKEAQKEMQAADYPRIRLFEVPRKVAARPQTDTQARWEACNPKTVPEFSAVGYFFGRDLHKELKVPVGLIHTSWGGTPAESWTELSVMQADPDFRPILDRWQQGVEKYTTDLSAWKEAAEKAKAESKPAPAAPGDPEANPWKPAGLYNAMITPLTPFAIRGAIWYQGESNAGRAYQYRRLLPAMIKSWRDAWGQDFAFLVVSLANFMKTQDQPGESAWAELREAQAMTAAQPHNGLAIIIDAGDAADIHPKDKQTVGRRLMLQALEVSYGKDVAAAGPTYDSMRADGGKVRIKFKNADGGLVAKGSVPTGFAVAGEDRKWHWAHAEIEGDSVIVWSPQVATPVAVRYAWADNPVCNLYNGADLPAAPFRTDDWPGVTQGKN